MNFEFNFPLHEVKISYRAVKNLFPLQAQREATETGTDIFWRVLRLYTDLMTTEPQIKLPGLKLIQIMFYCCKKQFEAS